MQQFQTIKVAHPKRVINLLLDFIAIQSDYCYYQK